MLSSKATIATATINPIRGAAILLNSFARNLAYYRVSLEPCAKPLLNEAHKDAPFWRQVHSNFIDMLTLEWCKLFGDPKSLYYWKQVIPKDDQAEFWNALLQTFSQNEKKFRNYVVLVRKYRDKFVAHLDNENIMDIPVFEEAEVAANLYYNYLVRADANRRTLVGLACRCDGLRHGRIECEQEARRIYLAARGAAPVP